MRRFILAGRQHWKDIMSVETSAGATGTAAQGAMVRVWSPIIRFGHWALVGAFALAYFTEDELLQVHTWAGYVAATAVLVRLIWGLVGPQQDRLTTFLRPPGEVLAYLRDALRLHSRRYTRHTPAGAVMALALLLSIAATTLTGMATLAETHNAGPLAPWFGKGGAQATLSLVAPARADESGEAEEGEGGVGEGHNDSAIKPVHEFFANLTLVLVLLHVSGVLLASFAHRENLARSMVTGLKPADRG